jgi:hypothetical protein
MCYNIHHVQAFLLVEIWLLLVAVDEENEDSWSSNGVVCKLPHEQGGVYYFDWRAN